MTVREYIGARYVPIFGRMDEESIEWDNTKPYEPLTIVLYQGNSYTSRQYVPVGVPITNQEFWALTGNYNAQVEAYRAEVRTYDDRITANSDAIANFSQELGSFEEETRQELETEAIARTAADTALGTRIDNEAQTRKQADTALGTRIDNEAQTRKQADTALGTRIDNEMQAINDRFPITTEEVQDNAITYDKLSIELQNRNRSIDMLTDIDAYIDGVNGDDKTAELGNRELPFKTLDAAFKASDERGNNFRFYFLKKGTYTWTMRVMVGAVVHIFTSNADGEVIIDIDNGAPNGGVFFYDTHLGLYSTQAAPLRIIAPQYMEVEGGTLWCGGGASAKTYFDMKYLYLISGSAFLTHIEMTRGYILGYFGNLLFNDVIINNKEDHAAFDWRCGVLRCEGTSMQIGRNANAGATTNAIELRSCTTSLNAQTGVTVQHKDYNAFLYCYSGITILADAVLESFNNYGKTNSVVNTLRISRNTVIPV